MPTRCSEIIKLLKKLKHIGSKKIYPFHFSHQLCHPGDPITMAMAVRVVTKKALLAHHSPLSQSKNPRRQDAIR